jgi:hypothetical protein
MSNIIDQIRACYERDRVSGVKAVELEDIPPSYEAITPVWLTRVICDATAGAVVTGFKLDKRDDGSTNRRRIFLEYNEAGRRAGLPSSIFCKASHELLSRLNLGLSNAAHNEVTFYKKVRPLLDLEIPVCLHAAYDPVSLNSIVVLKDLGDSAEFCTHHTELSYEQAKDQIGLLASYHGRFYQTPSQLDFHTWPTLFEMYCRFDLAVQCDLGFEMARDLMPPSLFRRRAEVWPATLRAVAIHRDERHTLLHCDPHFGQWYITRPGRMGLGDWQAVCYGHWARDIAYAMSTSLSIEKRRAWEKDLIRLYVDRLAAYGVISTFEDAWLKYRKNLMTALAWWTSTMAPNPGTQPSALQPKDRTREFLRRITHAVDDHQSIDSLAA